MYGDVFNPRYCSINNNRCSVWIFSNMTTKDIIDLYIKGEIKISECRKLLNKLLASQLVKKYDRKHTLVQKL